MDLHKTDLPSLLILKDFLKHKNYSTASRAWGVSREAARQRINRMLAALGTKPSMDCDTCMPELAKIIASQHGKLRGKFGGRSSKRN
jgi:hypothetical protein